MQNTFLFEKSIKNVLFLEEEVNRFPDLFEILDRIISRMSKGVDIAVRAQSDISIDAYPAESTRLVHVLPLTDMDLAPISNLILDDRGNYWGRVQFLDAYLEDGPFEYSVDRFRLFCFKNNRMKMLQGRDLTLWFLPFVVRRWAYSGIGRFLPHLKLKDAGYYGKYYTTGFCSRYRQTKTFRSRCDAVASRFDDAESRDTYRMLIRGDAKEHWERYIREIPTMYQYSDYIDIEGGTVVNCGVEIGTELPLFASLGVRKMINIDPSGDRHLPDYKKAFMSMSDVELTYVESALYRAEFVFKTENPFIVETLADIVDRLQPERIDLIKSDIEGAEGLMVEDLIQISKTYRPQMAISIYHSNHTPGKFILDDLVDIPEGLMNGLRDYKFYVKAYSFERFEVILYCIPKEISNRAAETARRSRSAPMVSKPASS